jgi:hypothetical protein
MDGLRLRRRAAGRRDRGSHRILDAAAAPLGRAQTRLEPWPGIERGLPFNYAQLQSLDLLRAKLAEVHDPDNMGTRVLCELIGAGVGVFAAWLLIVWRAHARNGQN